MVAPGEQGVGDGDAARPQDPADLLGGQPRPVDVLEDIEEITASKDASGI